MKNLRTQAIKLLSDTNAYEMATMIVDNVENTLKFYDDLGPLVKNGTVETHLCTVSVLADHITNCSQSSSTVMEKSCVACG